MAEAQVTSDGGKGKSLSEAALSLWTSCAFLQEVLAPAGGTNATPLSETASEGLASILGYMREDANALLLDHLDREGVSHD